jgi:PLP dependent protein
MDLTQIKTEICAVTKQRSLEEIQTMLTANPQIKIIAENRWPDCESAFKHFTALKRHFIGPLQSRKIPKVIPLIDCIQSVDSIELLEKIQLHCSKLSKTLDFCFQVNISQDPSKNGIHPEKLKAKIEDYIKGNFPNLKLIGLMTIGAQSSIPERKKYFKDFRQLLDQVNAEFFPNTPLPTLSMGMSEDFEIAIESGSTMLRLGRILFQNL